MKLCYDIPKETVKGSEAVRSFFGNPVVVFLFLMVFPPLGIFFMFHFTEWSMGWKMALSVIFGAIFVIAVVKTIQEDAMRAAQETMRALITLNM